MRDAFNMETLGPTMGNKSDFLDHNNEYMNTIRTGSN
jgi:hypothetical protein